ncbi:sulfurtransferase [Aquimarina sp. MMG016]|uniref:sulfurtransferase n=1 Tax=Aquimarina sp. MMG016 TaxID=2822690 RepID=UPI001B3A5BC0|nr:sulfurtransferase [Aquimarina sp. MMG016]MBQ4820157.1 sulfurtransferase [Aquimarina sp. MMG016]
MHALELTKPVVSVAWLSEHIDHPDLIILDATIKKAASDKKTKNADYQIKNTRFFDIKGSFSDKETNIPNMLPAPEIFAKACEDLGVNNHHTIIVYDKHGIYSSVRVWWMFKTMGYDNVAVLDGGLPAWQKANLPVEDSEKAKKTFAGGNFVTDFRPNLVCNAQDILSEMNNTDTIILDARSDGRFRAVDPEPRADLKGGHIPNSKSLPYTKLLEDGKILPEEELRDIFKNFNIENKKLIFTCGSGITACIILLAAELTGYQNVSVYDGSWSEWGQLKGVPIEC